MSTTFALKGRPNANLISRGGRGLKSQGKSSDKLKKLRKTEQDPQFHTIWAISKKVLDFLPKLW